MATTMKLNVLKNPNPTSGPDEFLIENPDDGSTTWDMTVGDTLEVSSSDGGSYLLWIYTGHASGQNPKGLFTSGERASWNDTARMYSIAIPSTGSVRVVLQEPDVLRGKQRSSSFGIGVSGSNGNGPKNDGGGSGSAGTLNVSPG